MVLDLGAGRLYRNRVGTSIIDAYDGKPILNMSTYYLSTTATSLSFGPLNTVLTLFSRTCGL